MDKNKNCKESKKITGFQWALALSVVSAIGKTISTIAEWCGPFIKPAAETGKIMLGAACVVLGFVSPFIWAGARFLSKTGFSALNDFLVDLYKDTNQNQIDTKNAKKVLKDIKKRLIAKDPKFEEHSIMKQIRDLTKLCYFIENMNETGMTKIEYEDMETQLTDGIKDLLIEFGNLMKDK